MTLSWVAPPGVRIAPFYPTNSVVISGPEAAVEQMVDAIRYRQYVPDLSRYGLPNSVSSVRPVGPQLRR